MWRTPLRDVLRRKRLSMIPDGLVYLAIASIAIAVLDLMKSTWDFVIVTLIAVVFLIGAIAEFWS